MAYPAVCLRNDGHQWTISCNQADFMTPAKTDAKLMQQYARGDLRAFETLYERHSGPLFRFILRSVNSRDTAEELFQEIWGKVIAAAPRYESRARFTTYLYRIARNTVIDQYRKGAGLSIVNDTNTVERASGHGQPQEAYENDELGRHLADAITLLPIEQRTAFLLRAEQGLRLDEIAAICGVGRETIKSRLRYASSKLRTSLEAARA